MVEGWWGKVVQWWGDEKREDKRRKLNETSFYLNMGWSEVCKK